MASKRKPGRPAKYTPEQRKAKRKEWQRRVDKERYKGRVYIGEHIARWNRLKEELGLLYNYEVAGYLLDRYENDEYTLDLETRNSKLSQGVVTVSRPNTSSNTAHLRKDEQTPGHENPVTKQRNLPLSSDVDDLSIHSDGTSNDISLQLEVDDGAESIDEDESVDDDSTSDLDLEDGEEMEIKEDPYSDTEDYTPQNSGSTCHSHESGEDNPSHINTQIKQEPVDNYSDPMDSVLPSDTSEKTREELETIKTELGSSPERDNSELKTSSAKATSGVHPSVPAQNVPQKPSPLTQPVIKTVISSASVQSSHTNPVTGVNVMSVPLKLIRIGNSLYVQNNSLPQTMLVNPQNSTLNSQIPGSIPRATNFTVLPNLVQNGYISSQPYIVSPAKTVQVLAGGQQIIAGAQQSTLCAQQPIIGAQQPTTYTIGTQQSTLGAHQPIGAHQSTIGNLQSIIGTQQQFMGTQQPIIGAQQPIIGTHEPTLGILQSIVGGQQPISGPQQPILGPQQVSSGMVFVKEEKLNDKEEDRKDEGQGTSKRFAVRKETKTREEDQSMTLHSADVSEVPEVLSPEKALSRGRFKSLSLREIRGYQEVNQTKSTKKQTRWATKILNDWHLETYGVSIDMESIPAEELAVKLEKFYCEAKPQHDQKNEEYNKNTMKAIRAAINRHFTDLGRNFDIVYDKQFKLANRSLMGLLRHRIAENTIHFTVRKEIIPKSDLHKISKYLETAYISPVNLRLSLWYILAVQFVRRGIEFHHQLNIDSFDFKVDETGREYARLCHEPQLNNNPGGGATDERLQPDTRMYATRNAVCPVTMLKYFLSKTDGDATKLFNQCEKDAVKNPRDNKIWYNSKPALRDSFRKFLPDICESVGCKRYTAYCLRVTMKARMNESGFENRHYIYYPS
ncbi:uncharacterized protein LOC134283232 [Saccostrea cucullata]|uniref:uncharacterized protein LOC134283232 n=1 Tax=Saccostrea cuccullata TaxID=36930 RepID=UPI002ED15F08